MKQTAKVEIESFLRRYAAARRQEHLVTAEELIHWWQDVQPQLGSLLEAAKDRRRIAAPDHNLFRLFELQNDEEGVHSRLLADFLDPDGSHGQGYLFLATFLKHLEQRQQWEPAKRLLEGTLWQIETERGIEHGRIDIVASCRQLGYLIAIENKVYAGEQEGQLFRYHQWLESQSRYYDRRCLVFLTPTGRAATSHQGCPYLRMSYRSNIAEVLRAAETHMAAYMAAPHVRATVQQYLNIICELSDFREMDDED